MKIFKKNTRTTTNESRTAVRGLELFTVPFLVKHLLKRLVLWYDWIVTWYAGMDRLIVFVIGAHLLDILTTWVTLGVAPHRLDEQNPLFNLIWENMGFVQANLIVASWILFQLLLAGVGTLVLERAVYWGAGCDRLAWWQKRVLLEPLRWAWAYRLGMIVVVLVSNMMVWAKLWVF